jgi:hypothetical protein
MLIDISRHAVRPQSIHPSTTDAVAVIHLVALLPLLSLLSLFLFFLFSFSSKSLVQTSSTRAHLIAVEGRLCPQALLSPLSSTLTD